MSLSSLGIPIASPIIAPFLSNITFHLPTSMILPSFLTFLNLLACLPCLAAADAAADAVIGTVMGRKTAVDRIIVIDTHHSYSNARYPLVQSFPKNARY